MSGERHAAYDRCAETTDEPLRPRPARRHAEARLGQAQFDAALGNTKIADSGQFVVGVDNVTDFVRPFKEGRLEVDARAASQGRTLQLWEVDITDDQGRLVAKGRVRLANRPNPD